VYSLRIKRTDRWASISVRIWVTDSSSVARLLWRERGPRRRVRHHMPGDRDQLDKIIAEMEVVAFWITTRLVTYSSTCQK
jgi:hypothetical protein